MMKAYARMASEGATLIIVPMLAIVYAALIIGALPFFLLGLVKRGVVVAFTHGDPRVP